MPKYAQEMDGWTSGMDLGEHEAGIKRLLYKRGAEEVATHYSPRKNMLQVQFEWEEEVFSIQYRPLQPKYSSRSNKDKLFEQALRQMGYIATGHIRSLLNLALEGMHPEMSTPYNRSWTGGGPTLQELGPDGFKNLLLAAGDGTLALEARNEQGDNNA